MPVSGTTKHENLPLPPFGKGGLGGFSCKDNKESLVEIKEVLWIFSDGVNAVS
jgi:hypothetical protein